MLRINTVLSLKLLFILFGFTHQNVLANSVSPAQVGNQQSSLIMKAGEYISVNTSLLWWVGYVFTFFLILSPWAIWYFRLKKENISFTYWGMVAAAFKWFKLSNLMAICLSALWVGVAHKELGEALGHYIPVLALLHIIFSTFEHHLRVFEETPEKIVKIIREEIEKSIKSQRVYVSGLQSTDLEGILNAIRHKDTLAESKHGFALIRFNSEPTHYSQVCLECLEHAKSSVNSMSDFDFDKGLIEFLPKGAAHNWTTEVNKKTDASTIKVHRIQVMNYARFEFTKYLIQYNKETDPHAKLRHLRQLLEYSRVSGIEPDSDIAKQFAERLVKGFNIYKELYWKKGDKYLRNLLIRTSSESGKTYKPVDYYAQHDQFACGEFILFDDDVLVRYMPSSKLLEVLIGRPVEEFKKTFNKIIDCPADCDFEDITMQLFKND